MSTVKLTIALPQELKAFVETRAKARGFGNADAYVRDLLRRDEERAAEERFAALIQEGLDSPRSPRTWDELRDDWTARIAAARETQNPTAQ